MELLIVGFPQSGKTTVFGALTSRHAAPPPRGGGTNGATVGVAKVPDPRLDVLSAMYRPERKVPADIRYVDTQGLGAGESAGRASVGSW